MIAETKFDTVAENYSDAEITVGKINFDLVGNVFFHLAELEARLDHTRDRHQCFPETASAFYPWRETPFVDNLLWLMDSMLKEHTRIKKKFLVQKCHYPEAQEAAVILSHSVDDLRKWDMNSLFLSIVDDLTMFFTLKWPQLYRNIVSKTKYLFTDYEAYWNFEEFRSMEREYNYKATYFVAADPGNDLDYTLDDTDMQEELASTLREGHEIGLLATDDKLNRDDFITRKQIMLHQIHRQDIGLRQFAYRNNEEIKDLHHKSTPRYSSSVAFREAPGYKNGISLPHHPWLLSHQAGYWELPTLFRNSYLQINKFRWMQLDDAKHLLKKIFQSTLRSRGIFGIDFTIASYTELPYCKKLYEYLLALLEVSKVWVTTPLELCKWWEIRRKVTIDESENEISILFPEDTEHFVLQIFNDVKIAEISGFAAKADGNMIRFSNVPAGAVCIIRLHSVIH